MPISRSPVHARSISLSWLASASLAALLIAGGAQSAAAAPIVPPGAAPAPPSSDSGDAKPPAAPPADASPPTSGATEPAMPAPPAKPAPGTSAATDAQAAPAAPPASPSDTAAPAPPATTSESFIELPALPEGVSAAARRAKPLRQTVGIPPTASDLGSELDVTAPGGDTAGADILQLQNWTLNVRGYIRAPMRVGLGPSDDPGRGRELHSPPRMAGFSSSNWAYIAIAPNPSASLRTTISNPRVSGTLILNAGTFSEQGYDDIDSLGGVTQGYLTLRFPETFGSRGGLAWTVGGFSNSYGTSGPRQTNTGYYATYLFGRIHGVGSDLTADIDLDDHWELLIEHGFGAKLDLLPLLGGHLPKQMFIPGDPRAPLGSAYYHHAHVALWNDNWLKIAAHYLTGWSPNDRLGSVTYPGESRLSSTGMEVHIDHPRWGSGYLGYSHVWGHNLLPLDEVLQVIHGGRGYDFKLQYFGNKFRQYRQSSFLNNDSGRVETILFQHTFRSWEVLEYPGNRPHVNLSLFAMFSHAYSPPQRTILDLTSFGGPAFNGNYTINDNKLKYGTIVEYAFARHLQINGRFDRVQPTEMDKEQSYTALTGQLQIRSDWRQNRMIILGYTRFFLRQHVYPDSPYSDVAYNGYTDNNLFVVTAIMSL